MTNDQIRVAMAEACGWQQVRVVVGKGGCKCVKGTKPGYTFKWPRHTPDYLGDLRAMHQAWRDNLSEQQQWEFCYELAHVIERDYPDADTFRRNALEVNATAKQRAEAYLRTVGKWGGAA